MINNKNNNFTRDVEAVAVVVFVKESLDSNKEKILLLLENETRPWKNKGDYSPIFGTMIPGESPYQTAIRESQEEAGLDLTKAQLIDKGEFVSYIKVDQGVIRTFNHIFHVILDNEPIIKQDLSGEIGGSYFEESTKIGKGNLNLRPGSLEVISGYNSNEEVGVLYLENGRYLSVQ